MSIESLVRHLGVVEDPRCQGKIEHRLIDILVIAVCAVVACAESWDDIALYGRSKLGWLRKGFGFAGTWTVREQNRLLALCFGLPEVNKV